MKALSSGLRQDQERGHIMGQGLYSGIGFGCIIEGAEHWQENTAGLDAKSLAWEVERRIREELGSEGELDDYNGPKISDTGIRVAKV